MALHGDVRINGVVVGKWSATRVEPLRDNGSHEYACMYERTSAHGDGYAACMFPLSHTYADGAETLAALVLTTAAGRLRK